MDLLPSAKFFLALWQSMQAKKHDEKYPVHSILLFYPSSFSQKKRKEEKKKLLAFTRQMKFTLNTISKQTFIHTLTLEDFQGKVPPEPNQYY